MVGRENKERRKEEGGRTDGRTDSLEFFQDFPKIVAKLFIRKRRLLRVVKTAEVNAIEMSQTTVSKTKQKRRKNRTGLAI